MGRAISKKVLRSHGGFPFLGDLPVGEQALLLSTGTELVVPPGTLLASSRGRSCQSTLLVDGVAAWFEPHPTGGFDMTRQLGPGDFLDEETLSWLCAIEDGPGGFRVESLACCRVVAFDRREFRWLVSRAPGVGCLAAARTSAHLGTWARSPGVGATGDGEGRPGRRPSVSAGGRVRRWLGRLPARADLLLR